MILQAGLQDFNKKLQCHPDRHTRRKLQRDFQFIDLECSKVYYFDGFGSDTKGIAAGKTQYTSVLHFLVRFGTEGLQ